MKPLIFNTGKQYLSEEQKEVLDEFCATPREIGTKFKKGTTTFVLGKIEYPLGAVTPETIRVGTDEQDGTIYYKTPLATGEDKKGRVWCFIQKEGVQEKTAVISFKQWLHNIKDAQIIPRENQVVEPTDKTMIVTLKKKMEAGQFEGGENWLTKEVKKDDSGSKKEAK